MEIKSPSLALPHPEGRNTSPEAGGLGSFAVTGQGLERQLRRPGLPGGWEQQPPCLQGRLHSSAASSYLSLHRCTHTPGLSSLFKTSAPLAVRHTPEGQRQRRSPSTSTGEGTLPSPWHPWGRSSSGGSAHFSVSTGEGGRGGALGGAEMAGLPHRSRICVYPYLIQYRSDRSLLDKNLTELNITPQTPGAPVQGWVGFLP